MSRTVEVDKLPACDLCPEDAYADASLPTHRGSWAYVCRDHFAECGCDLGLGRGQRLEVRR